jgi:hypothetical protein
MADDPTRDPELTAELISLRRQHSEAITDATFLSWTPEAEAAHNKRAARMAQLTALLAELNRIPD